MKSPQEKEEAFKAAARWLHERGGDAAVVRAFGDPAPIDEAWEMELEEFKEFLRGRCRAALESRRGAA